MRFGLEALFRQARADARMVLCDQADEVLHEQRLLVEARVQLRHEADRQVDLAVLEAPATLGRDDLGFESNARCRATQVVEQAGQQHDLADVGHAHAEGPARQGRIEGGAAAAGGLQLRQHFAQMRQQAFGMRRGLHAARGAGEQPVVEVHTQLVEHGADGRLRQAQLLGRLRHAAGLVDLVEHGEPLEIELGHGTTPGKTMRALWKIAITSIGCSA